ncbi:hypothetical protein [Pseudarthrobacter enclensis]|uniref:Uncharacterized protein YlxP (DUF503 family) n=1 Tax=Pseudarthrobacter enclensis TaxID=993070 RepID=A0ABT9RTS6_9MICC|nr:hypothetical protein [Pseudarthrobacter enclensis]MDP9888643.1 uncharacterized protein YlxP (DUF503 family) [Pseudarthrobacter enclensis]
MSESDGIDDVLDNGLRQSLMLAARVGETLARRRQEFLREREHQDTQGAHEAHARYTAERAQMQGALAPVHDVKWWQQAQPADITNAYLLSEAWKDHDPAALTAADRIRHEVYTRYGIDTHEVGADDAYLQSGIETVAVEQARLNAAREHEKAVALIAAAQAEELRARAQRLAPAMERHQVPVEYLSNEALAAALQQSQDARTPEAVEAADADVKERLYLIGKDGINGPTIDQLRDETTAAVNGAGDDHFKDPAFVKAAQEMHEAKLLAEAGFTGAGQESVEQRYERAERELFARIEGLGREIEDRVSGNDNERLTDQGLKAETASAAGYGSAEHHEDFAATLRTSGATETQIRGRLTAARSEGTHPNAAVTAGLGVAKARKSRPGKSLGAERGKSGLSR